MGVPYFDYYHAVRSEDGTVLGSILFVSHSHTYSAHIYGDESGGRVVEARKEFKTKKAAHKWLERNLQNDNDGRP